MRRGKRSGRGDAPGQFHIDWVRPSETALLPPDSLPAVFVQPPLVQYLKWDFATTFPQPTPEAIDAGVVSDEDCTLEAIRTIHEEHAREAMAVLQEMDIVSDARRRGVDPRNNKTPMLEPARERLRQFFVTEPKRLEFWWSNLMDVYEQSFGADAADAFAKALRARHAGIPVRVEPAPPAAPTPSSLPKAPSLEPAQTIALRRLSRSRSPIARLPVPRPLPSAVAAARFGQDEKGKPIRPGAQEVRAITEQHAEKLIGLLDTMASSPASSKESVHSQFMAGIAAYAEDFGQAAADQLAAYAQHQAGPNSNRRRGR